MASHYLSMVNYIPDMSTGVCHCALCDTNLWLWCYAGCYYRSGILNNSLATANTARWIRLRRKHKHGCNAWQMRVWNPEWQWLALSVSKRIYVFIWNVTRYLTQFLYSNCNIWWQWNSCVLDTERLWKSRVELTPQAAYWYLIFKLHSPYGKFIPHQGEGAILRKATPSMCPGWACFGHGWSCLPYQWVPLRLVGRLSSHFMIPNNLFLTRTCWDQRYNLVHIWEYASTDSYRC